jgi:hypothetical protein
MAADKLQVPVPHSIPDIEDIAQTNQPATMAKWLGRRRDARRSRIWDWVSL